MSITDKRNEKKWNILVPYFFDELSNVAIYQSIELCKVFNSGLVLYAPSKSDDKKQVLANLVQNIIDSHQINVQCYSPNENGGSILFALAHKTESILIVMAHNKKQTSLQYSLKRTLRLMRKSRTPFLFVPKCIQCKTFDKIAYCVGYQRNEKEKILWASYFGRIYKSKIHIVAPKVSDQFFKTGIVSNIQAMDKLYKNVEVDYQIIRVEDNIHKATTSAINYAATINAGAFIILTTLRPDIFDFFFGNDDIKAVCNKVDMPILCINPRDDLYMLCN